MHDITIDFLRDYGDADSMYLCDAISEFADGRVSVYYSDSMEFLREHTDAVEDAIAEFGWDGVGGSLHKAAQMAEFLTTERELYDDLSEFDSGLTIGALKDDDPNFKKLLEEARND